jgi:hypothetical protein
MIIPKEIGKYLVRDEIIEKEFHLRGRFELTGYKVYVSNKRLFIRRGNSIRDIDYNHIASIELKQERSPAVVIVGLVSIAIGAAIVWLEFTFGWAFVAFGTILFVLGLMRTQYMELGVAGLTYPFKLSGHRSELDSLFRLVREKRI